MRTATFASFGLGLCIAGALAAQETYWVANRNSVDLSEINTAGKVVRTIPLNSYVAGLRSVHQAPDGKLWVVCFITPTFLIVDPVTSTVTPLQHGSGNPFDIAFDRAGHAWVSGGTNLIEYDQNGVQLNSIGLTAGSPLGISIDDAGNKWIAHRTAAPGSISRVDPAGVVTNFPLVGGNIQPGRIMADFRGILQPSHIWVIGDGPAQLFEFDANGTQLNMYTYSGQLGSITQAADGSLWLGDFSAGANLFHIDPANGAILNNWTSPPAVLGVAVDGYDHLWATVRITATPAVPSEVRRITPATGATEIAAQVGTGTQSSLSTRLQFATVVDPFGDLDGDTNANLIEVMNGSSPFDACSTGVTSLRVTGVTRIANTAAVEVNASASSFSIVGFSFGALAPGAGIPVPGFGCTLRLDPTLAGGFTGVVGAGALNVNIPNNPALVGLELYTQAATFGAASQFSNLAMIKVW